MVAGDSWNDRRRIHVLLGEDLRIATSLIGKTEDQFARRTIVRTLFSMIDGLCWYLKTEALNGAGREGIQFSRKHLRVLNEATEAIDENGKPIRRRRFPSAAENVKVSMAAFARIRGSEVPPEVRDLPSGFFECLNLRHRITHPKATTDLAVSDIEFGGLRSLLAWLRAASGWVSVEDFQYIERVKQASNEMCARSIREIQ